MKRSIEFMPIFPQHGDDLAPYRNRDGTEGRIHLSVHRVLAAALAAARSDRFALPQVVEALPSLRDPAAHEAAMEIETLFPKDPGYAATFHALLGRAVDVERLATIAMDKQQRWLIAGAFERLGDFQRADAADPARQAVYEAIAYGDQQRIATLVTASLAALPDKYLYLHTAANMLGKTGQRERAQEYARRAEASLVLDLSTDIAVPLARHAELYADLGAFDDALRMARKAEEHANESGPDPTAKKKASKRKHRPDYMSSAIPLLARIHERAGDRAYAARLMRKHADALVANQAPASQIARFAAEMGDVAMARDWLREPFVDRGRPRLDATATDRLHVDIVHAHLFLGEPAQAIEHAAMIVNPTMRVEPLIAIARWLNDHEAVELDSALAKLDAAPIEGPVAYR